MARIGLSPDELAATWSAEPRRYAAHVPGLDVLVGETVALVGDGTGALLETLVSALSGSTTWIDGRVAAAGGVLRVHAQQAARVGVPAVAITGPFDAGLGPAALALAVADLAGLRDLGLTTVVEVADVTVAARLADRVVVTARGRAAVAYPVVTPYPREAVDVATVVDRVGARLAALT